MLKIYTIQDLFDCAHNHVNLLSVVDLNNFDYTSIEHITIAQMLKYKLNFIKFNDVFLSYIDILKQLIEGYFKDVIHTLLITIDIKYLNYVNFSFCNTEIKLKNSNKFLICNVFNHVINFNSPIYTNYKYINITIFEAPFTKQELNYMLKKIYSLVDKYRIDILQFNSKQGLLHKPLVLQLTKLF